MAHKISSKYNFSTIIADKNSYSLAFLLNLRTLGANKDQILSPRVMLYLILYIYMYMNLSYDKIFIHTKALQKYKIKKACQISYIYFVTHLC